tara:strand:+ start:245 stop:463 length:219 start_codon:yes stop_codon:yes gene_type:complete
MFVEIERTSPLTGKINYMVVETTQDQIDEWNNPNRTKLIQDIFHDLTDIEREFIMTGYSIEDWEVMEKLHDE